ncbi:MAG: polysaccharide pyruvyl transferase family protein [Bacteroidota bacterium]
MDFRFPWNKSNSDNQVFLSYDNHQNNFGDILNPIIANHFGSKEVKRISKLKSRRFIHYYMIGSILQRCNSNSIIWGSGLISSDTKCKQAPKKVLAVRGPLTRDRLIKQGIECPKIYGDPALLLPEIYPVTNRIVKYKLGIIPHFRDKNNAWLKSHFSQNPEIKIIDIQNKDPLKVVDDMLMCEKIISSSLHGIIVADAYKIPAVWVEFSDLVEGNGFKFRDYYMSVGRTVETPFQLEDFKNLNEILKVFEDYEINIDLETLKNSFPF